VLPNTPTSTARIKVEAYANVFFDISNTNFTILASPPPAPGWAISTATGGPTSRCSGRRVGLEYTVDRHRGHDGRAVGEQSRSLSPGTMTATVIDVAVFRRPTGRGHIIYSGGGVAT
jgi:hypothetical protein